MQNVRCFSRGSLSLPHVLVAQQTVKILLIRPSTLLRRPASTFGKARLKALIYVSIKSRPHERNSAFSLGFALYLARLSEFQQPIKKC